MAAFFEKVRTEEVAMEEEKIRLAEDARREMAATAKALARGLPRGDETSDWRRVTRPLFADNEQHYAESNQVKGENEVVLANSRDDDEQRSDECHSIGWWKIEDDVFENCEDTRAQEIALRSEKERVIETDVAAREKEVALRRSQQAQRKDDRTKRVCVLFPANSIVTFRCSKTRVWHAYCANVCWYHSVLVGQHFEHSF